MKNLLNWLFGNKKFLVNYRIRISIKCYETTKNNIIWCKDISEIKETISQLEMKRKLAISEIEYCELPAFSKAKNYIKAVKIKL